MKGIATAVISSLILTSCKTSKPVSRNYIITPYHIFTNDSVGVKPKEVF